MRLFSYILTARAQLGTQILQKTKKKTQIMQNNCIRFCLRLAKMQLISLAKFKSMNWLPTKERVHQCIDTITFNKNCPFYLSEMLEFALHCRINARNSFAKLKHPFCKTNTGQRTLSCIGPSLWNNLPETIKKRNNLNTFKHKVKSLYLNQ